MAKNDAINDTGSQSLPRPLALAIRAGKIAATAFAVYVLIFVLATGILLPVKHWNRIRDIAVFVSHDKLVVAVDMHDNWRRTGLIESGHLGPPSSVHLIEINKDGLYSTKVFRDSNSYCLPWACCLSPVFSDPFVIDGTLVLLDVKETGRRNIGVRILCPSGAAVPASETDLSSMGVDVAMLSSDNIRSRLAMAALRSGWTRRPKLAADLKPHEGIFARTSVQISEGPGFQAVTVSNTDPDNTWSISPVVNDTSPK